MDRRGKMMYVQFFFRSRFTQASPGNQSIFLSFFFSFSGTLQLFPVWVKDNHLWLYGNKTFVEQNNLKSVLLILTDQFVDLCFNVQKKP